MSAIRTTYLGLIIPEQGQEGRSHKADYGADKKGKITSNGNVVMLAGPLSHVIAVI